MINVAVRQLNLYIPLQISAVRGLREAVGRYVAEQGRTCAECQNDIPKVKFRLQKGCGHVAQTKDFLILYAIENPSSVVSVDDIASILAK